MFRLIESYREWLAALNYEQGSINNGPEKIREFMVWLASQEIKEIRQITAEVVERYFNHLSHRKNKRTGGGLSTNYLRSYLRELKRFSRYLRETEQGHIEVSIQIKGTDCKQQRIEIFTRTEIKNLYQACDDDYLGIRDRAMLSVYYGCGLRREEGVQLEVKDVQFGRGMLYVRKGKNYKERYVPMVGRVMSDLRDYLEYGRTYLETEKTGQRLFVSYRGGTVGGVMMSKRFRQLRAKALVDSTGSIHTLRHSIATHLLEGGMDIEDIARFLGHSTLESTQIYTHVLQNQI